MVEHMRVLVYPKGSHIGGSQVVAVDLARAVRARGHHVSILLPPGPLNGRAVEGDVAVIEDGRLAPRAASPGSLAALSSAIRRERPDLVHVYEASPRVHALYAAQLTHDVPIVTSILTMWVPWYLPASGPVLIGAPRKAKDFERRWASTAISLLPPAVDTSEYQPSADASDFVAAHDLDSSVRIALVSRLDVPFKLEGIERTIEAVAALEAGSTAQLVIVGDGPAMHHVRSRASAVNERAGRRVVVLTGELSDPVAAYAACDIVVGSGLSILRGMACGKPAVVVGREGFSKIVCPDTIEALAHRGFYGLGAGRDGVDPLHDQLATLVQSESLRTELGEFSRQVVQARFDLNDAAGALESIYSNAIENRAPRREVLADAVATPVRLWRYRQLKARLEVEVAGEGHVGDAASARVSLRLADRLASR
jgi:glycosyltransferase involved in cell wall biosynthesis